MKRFKSFLGVLVITLMVFVTGVNAATVDEEKAPDKVFIGWDPNVTVEVKEDIFYVTLKGDINQDLIIESGEEVVLDLNGFTFNNFTKECEAIKVMPGGKLTITDNSEAKSGTVTHIADSTYSPITNLGELIVDGGNYEINDDFYLLRNEGTLTINAGTFKSTSKTTSMIGNIQYEDTSVVPNLTINNGEFTAINNVVRNNENSVVTINGGTLTSESAYALDNLAEATVNAGALTSENNSPVRNIINSETGKNATLKVAAEAVLSSTAEKANYALYDTALKSDVTANYNVNIDENGNITFISTEIPDPVPEKPSEEIENPSTSDNVMTYVLIGSVSLVGIAATALFIKKFN